MIETLHTAVRDFSPLSKQIDDITAILLKVETGRPESVSVSSGAA